MALSDPISEGQISFIQKLCAERGLSEEQEAFIATRLGDLNRGQAHKVIETMKALPVKASHAARQMERRGLVPEVPAGRYALIEDGAVKFFRVDRPTEGRWKGYTFVKAQASDDLYPVKDPVRRNAILAAIKTDIQGSLRLYGQQLGHCGVCGKALTDEYSRAYGIGPVCRSKQEYGLADSITAAQAASAAVPAPVSGPVLNVAPAARPQAQIKTEREQALSRVRRTETVAPGSIADNALALLAKDGVKGVQMGSTAYVRPEVNAPSSYDAIMKLRENFKR